MNHPGIWQVGTLRDDGTPAGWGIGPCQTQCLCHRGRAGNLTIHEGNGTLGLHQWRPCTCCTPWTVDELAAILTDLDRLAALETA